MLSKVKFSQVGSSTSNFIDVNCLKKCMIKHCIFSTMKSFQYFSKSKESLPSTLRISFKLSNDSFVYSCFVLSLNSMEKSSSNKFAND